MLSLITRLSKFFLFILAVLCTTATVRAQDNLTARRPFGQHTVSFSATPTFDAGISDSFKMTLTGNVTSSTLIGAEAGHLLTFEICQDGTGGRTFAWPSQMSGAIAILSGAGVCTTEMFQYDGATAANPTTATSGGGGSGTVNSGTAGHYTYYATSSTTVSSNANLDDGVTNTNGLTYAGTAGIFSPSFNATSSGAYAASGTEGACPPGVAGKDILCLGDSLSHTAKLALNGGSELTVPQYSNDSPTPFGPLCADGTFPRVITVPIGSLGQPLISAGNSACFAYGPLDLSSSNNVVNRLVKANLPTTTVFNDQVNTATSAFTLDLSASTAAAPFRFANIAGFSTTTNGVAAYNTTTNNLILGMNSGNAILPVTTITPVNSNCVKWVITSGNYQLGDAGAACSAGGGSPALNTITPAAGTNTIDNANFFQKWRWQGTSAGIKLFELSETAASTSTGTPYLLFADTVASSTLNPVGFTAGGTANGWNMTSGALWAPLGTGSIAIPGSAKGIVVSQGGSAATTTVTGTNNQLVSFDGSGNPIAADPIISFAYVNIWTAQDVTTTRTSAAVRNPIFSQSGTLQLTWASITGSPATCTLQIQGVDSVGNVLNNGSTFSVSPANGTTSQTFTAAASLQSAAQIKAIFACVTYPTTGTLTLDYTPMPNVNVTNTVTVSGTVTTTPPANASTNLAQVAGTTADTNSGNKSAGTLRVVLATDQPALTNKLLVTPDSVALPANQSVNVNQVAGTAVDTNSGNKSAGTQRVVLATDQPNLTTPLNDNVAQINGVTPLMGNGTTGTGSPRVTIASDNTAFSVNATDVGNKSDDGAASGTDRLGTLPAIEQSQLPAAGTTGRNKALRTDLNGTLYSGVMPTNITTYSTNKLGLVPAASPTDIAVLPGNATNTVIVTRVQVSCTQTTAGIIDLQLIKRSTADTAGTSASMTIVPLDSGNAAAVSAPLTYTANPTTGTAVGNVDSVKLACLAPATAGAADIYVWKPGMGQSIVLRGTAQQLAVNLNGVTLTGGSVNITFSWIETTGL